MHLDQQIMAAKPTESTLRDKLTNWAVIGVPIIIALVLLVTPYISGGTDIKSALGTWDSPQTGWRVTFHPDKTIDITSQASSAQAPSANTPPSSGASVAQGWFTPNTNGMLEVKMKDGKIYTAFFRELTPDQFDLVDKQSGNVVEFRRAH